MQKGDQDLGEWLNGGRDEPVSEPHSGSSFLVAVVALVLVAGGVTAGYAFHEQSAAKHMAVQNADMMATVAGLRNQLDAVTAKLNELSAAQTLPVRPAAQPAKSFAPRPQRPTPSGSDRRYKQLQARLDAQQKELKDTQDSVSKTRADLESSLSSAKGSIARNHDELVSLEKRGERNYFEFDITKSKQFQRTGPVSISLRHTDTKHMNYDAVVLMDDNQLAKKHVDLFEPIWFDRADDPQPLELVVNQVDKNHVHGYVSTPRYRNSELAANNGSGALRATRAANGDAQSAATQQDHNPNAPLEQPQ